jgi:hypothetical protein
MNRGAVAASLGLSGIETGVHYEPAVHQHPVWESEPLRHGVVPNAAVGCRGALPADAP